MFHQVNRRQALGILGASALLSTTSSMKAADYSDLKTNRYLGEVDVLATIEDDKVFTEGPAWGNGALYFTNVPAGKILKWDGRKLSVYRENSNHANGLHFDSAGNLWACEGGGGGVSGSPKLVRAGCVTRTDWKSGEITVLASEFNSFPLASPNDLCFDYQGRLFFSSRPGADDPAKGNVNAVYRLDPDGSLEQVLAWPDIHMPNGLVTSPNGRKLYLIEAHPDAEHHRDIRSYEITEDGKLVGEKIVIDFYPGRSGDGMAIDAKGNLYVAAGLHATRKTSETLDTKPGIHVISPQGKILAFRETPEDTITNCTFGGKNLKTLFVTCGTKLLAIPTRIPGKTIQ